ncbi:PQQ-like beta-propeller repeat protein [bacterium]|nr:PQQ-like beta-propeller repeat protein [bacterium]
MKTAQVVRKGVGGDYDVVLLGSGGPLTKALNPLFGEPLGTGVTTLVSEVAGCAEVHRKPQKCAATLTIESAQVLLNFITAAAIFSKAQGINQVAVISELETALIKTDFNLNAVASQLGVPTDLTAIVNAIAIKDGLRFALFSLDFTADLPPRNTVVDAAKEFLIQATAVADAMATAAKCRVACNADGTRDDTEQCDGSDLGGTSCATLGFQCGALRCNSDCTLNTSACAYHDCTAGGMRCLDDGLTRQTCADHGSGCLTWGDNYQCAAGCAGDECAAVPTATPTCTPTATRTELLVVPPAWPMYGRNSRHTGAADVVGPHTSAVRWVAAMGGSLTSSPVVGLNSQVYASSSDGFLYALAADGSFAWSVAGVANPAVGQDGTLYATGETVICSPPCYIQGVLRAFSSDGQPRWDYTPDPPFWFGTLVHGADGGIYSRGITGGCPFCTGTILVIDPAATGATERWRDSDSGYVGIPGVATSGEVFVFSGGVIGFTAPSLWKFAPATGARVHLGDYLATKIGPVIGPDSTLYFGDGGFSGVTFVGDFRAVRADGTEQWAHRNFPVVGGIAAFQNGTVYHGHYNDLVAERASDGAGLWSLNLNPDGSNWFERNPQPVVDVAGNVYVGTSYGRVYAINPDGTEKWRFDTGSVIDTQPAIGSDGTLYVGARNGTLYAFGQ